VVTWFQVEHESRSRIQDSATVAAASRDSTTAETSRAVTSRPSCRRTECRRRRRRWKNRSERDVRRGCVLTVQSRSTRRDRDDGYRLDNAVVDRDGPHLRKLTEIYRRTKPNLRLTAVACYRTMHWRWWRSASGVTPSRKLQQVFRRSGIAYHRQTSGSVSDVGRRVRRHPRNTDWSVWGRALILAGRRSAVPTLQTRRSRNEQFDCCCSESQEPEGIAANSKPCLHHIYGDKRSTLLKAADRSNSIRGPTWPRWTVSIICHLVGWCFSCAMRYTITSPHFLVNCMVESSETRRYVCSPGLQVSAPNITIISCG